MTMEIALNWIEKLIAFAILLQTTELLQIRHVYADQGVWSWNILRQEFKDLPIPIQKFFHFFLSYKSFQALLQIRLIAAMVILVLPQIGATVEGDWVHTALIVFLTFSTWLISVRWRGSFNGGSDYMTFIVLISLSIALLGHDSEKAMRFGVWYITVQTCLSFFISGIVKFRRRSWQSGTALAGFLGRTNYYVPPLAQKMVGNVWIGRLAARFIILFECSFPVALLNKYWAIAYITIAMIFHLVNFYVFGLNRFVFAWAAAYPAVYFAAGNK